MDDYNALERVAFMMKYVILTFGIVSAGFGNYDEGSYLTLLAIFMSTVTPRMEERRQ